MSEEEVEAAAEREFDVYEQRIVELERLLETEKVRADEGWADAYKQNRALGIAIARRDAAEAELKAVGPEKTYCTKCGQEYRYIPGTHSIEYCFACIEGAVTEELRDQVEDLYNVESWAETCEEDIARLRLEIGEAEELLREVRDSYRGYTATELAVAVDAVRKFLGPEKSKIDLSQVASIPSKVSEQGSVQRDVPDVAGPPDGPKKVP